MTSRKQIISVPTMKKSIQNSFACFRHPVPDVICPDGDRVGKLISLTGKRRSGWYEGRHKNGIKK